MQTLAKLKLVGHLAVKVVCVPIKQLNPLSGRKPLALQTESKVKLGDKLIQRIAFRQRTLSKFPTRRQQLFKPCCLF